MTTNNSSTSLYDRLIGFRNTTGTDTHSASDKRNFITPMKTVDASASKITEQLQLTTGIR